MIEQKTVNKPLTEEQRKTAELLAASGHPWASCVEGILAAEAYWREAVKKAAEFPNEDACTFCGAAVEVGPHVSHTPECA